MKNNHQDKIIHLASDHAGFDLKEEIKEWLMSEGKKVVDHGASYYDPDDDFPDYIRAASLAVADDENAVAIVFGGSGEGEAMEANRHKGVRAAVYYGVNPEIITLSRTHNNANVLSLGARFLDGEIARGAIDTWLNSDFYFEEKRVRRNAKLDV